VNTGYLLWRRQAGRRTPGQLLAAALVASFAISVSAFALEQAETTLAIKVFWNQVQYVGDAPLVAFLFAYVLVYLGHDLSTRHYAALSVLPVVVLLGVFTNPLHGLHWTGHNLSTAAGYVVLDNELGPLFWLYVVYTYAFLLGSLVLLAQAAVNSTGSQRRQLSALILGTTLPGLAGVAYIFEVGPTPTPNYVGYAYIGTAIAFTYTAHRHNLFSTVPIARRTTLAQLDAGLITLDNHGYVVSVNESSESILNRAEADLLGHDGRDVLGKFTPAVDFDATAPRESTVTTEDSVFDITQSPLRRGEASIGSQLLIRDVTTRHRREQTLETLNTRLELALKATKTGVWEWDLDTDELIWDDASKQLFGYDTASGTETYDAFAERLPPEDLIAVEDAIEQAIETGEEYESDFRIKDPDGTQRWIQARGVVEYDDDGAPDRMYGIQTDITDQKAYEQKLEETNRKLEVLNRIVRHDIGNDMTVVIGLGEYLAEEIDDEMAQEYLERIVDQGVHVAELTDTIRDLMDTMLNESETTKPIYLAPILAQEIESLRSVDDSVTVYDPEDVPNEPVLADEALAAVFRNLLTNAVRHNDTDRPEIWVDVTDGSKELSVRIADNGPGIPETYRDEIFGRGEKGLESPGSGVGLYLVDTLVNGYGGEVRIEESAHGGAAFIVHLQKFSSESQAIQ
jgi:PAS domain S-box-containing protein